jgi:hypothetical protein
MVQCDKCEGHFHIGCGGSQQRHADVEDHEFVCNDCNDFTCRYDLGQLRL